MFPTPVRALRRFVLLLTLSFWPCVNNQVIVSGISSRLQGAHEVDSLVPGESFTLKIFGKNLGHNAFESIWLTDADSCHETGKREVPLTVVPTYRDSYGLLVQSEKGLPDGINVTYRLCTASGRNTASDQVLRACAALSADPILYVFIAVFILLLFFSGLLSGLNLAFTCLTLDNLALLSRSENDPTTAKQAQRALVLRKRGNLLIATFAIANTLVNNTAAIVAERLFVNVIVVNTVPALLMLLFGELMPQALFLRRALWASNVFRWFVYALIAIFYPIALPISKLLDWLLGKEPIRVYDVKKLRVFLEKAAKKETQFLKNVFNFKHIVVGRAMTRIQDAFMLSRNDVLDAQRIVAVLEKGYTRVPVYEGLDRREIVAVLNVKDLMLVDPAARLRVAEVVAAESNHATQLRFVHYDTPASVVYTEMCQGSQHLAMVVRFHNKSYSVVGLVTLEDIIEELFGDIKDDDDAAFPTHRAAGRRDQSTFDWFRQVDQRTGMSANHLLRVMERLSTECPIFSRLAFDVHALRALFDVSVLKKYPGPTLFTQGTKLKQIHVFVDGQIASGGNLIMRPVFGQELLEAFYERVLARGDQAALNDLEVTVPCEVTSLSARAAAIVISLEDVLLVLRVIRSEKLTDDIATQCDPYLRIRTVMAELSPKALHSPVDLQLPEDGWSPVTPGGTKTTQTGTRETLRGDIPSQKAPRAKSVKRMQTATAKSDPDPKSRPQSTATASTATSLTAPTAVDDDRTQESCKP